MRLICVALLLGATSASAQDVFELEVFPFETLEPGRYEVELHTNGVSRGFTSADAGAARHQPVHLSGEITRGWTRRVDTALFLQTAPFGNSRTTRFAGGHVRAKVRLVDTPALPVRIGVSAEYAFNRAIFDDELQALEIRPILDRRDGRLSLVLNPGLELAIKGSERGHAPSFDLAAKAAWSLASGVAINAEYFSQPGTIRHLQPDDTAHHLLFAGVDLAVSRGWEVSLGLGHCVTSNEPWVMKSVVGFGFGR